MYCGRLPRGRGLARKRTSAAAACFRPWLDIPASYHLCVAHDDALQGVTLVTRGADLRPATSLHRLLQTLLGWPEPAYAHHPLILGPDGIRLAKRDAATSLRSLRASGLEPGQVLARLGVPALP